MVLITSVGTDEPFFPLNLLWGVLFWKKRAEEELQRSGLDYTILRPGTVIISVLPHNPVTTSLYYYAFARPFCDRPASAAAAVLLQAFHMLAVRRHGVYRLPHAHMCMYLCVHGRDGHVGR